MRKRVWFFAALFCLVVLSGCGDVIVYKLAKQEPLNEREQQEYQEHKAEYDKAVKAKKIEDVEFGAYKPATDQEVAEGKRLYKRRVGKASEFDISQNLTRAFGLYPGDEIYLPEGGKKAWVVGIYDNNLWFHVEGEKGATFTKASDMSSLLAKGFRLPRTAVPMTAQASQAENSTSDRYAKLKEVGPTDGQKETKAEREMLPDGRFAPIPPVPPLSAN